MDESKDAKGLTRRSFMRSLGLGGMAASALALPETIKALEQSPAKLPTLPKRKLGKTGLEVSILSLGGMFDTINNQLLLKQAHHWGVNFWDTAEGYGNGKSEEGFGRYFSRYPEARKDIIVVTKARPSTSESLTESLERSLKKLASDYVDLFYVHAVADIGELGGPLKEWVAGMKKAGKMRFFGFSTHTNMEDCLIGASKLDWVDAVMFTYNFRLIQTPKMKEALEACTQAGVGLVAMKTQGGGPVKTDSEAELQLAGRFLEKGYTDKQARLKAVWENPSIASICSQMPSLTILASNVAAARDLTTLSRNDFMLFEQFAEETREGYCAGCGRICQEAVGGIIPVSDVMRCLMYYHDYGDRETARDVFAGLPERVRLNLGEVDYSDAERRCPQGLAIGRLMHEASRILC
ncbi:MAG: aldo/keto reductase [Syntrophobacteraceae bacterium]